MLLCNSHFRRYRNKLLINAAPNVAVWNLNCTFLVRASVNVRPGAAECRRRVKKYRLENLLSADIFFICRSNFHLQLGCRLSLVVTVNEAFLVSLARAEDGTASANPMTKTLKSHRRRAKIPLAAKSFKPESQVR